MSQMRKLQIQSDFSKKFLEHLEKHDFQESEDAKQENILTDIDDDETEEPDEKMQFSTKGVIAKISSREKLKWTSKMVKLLLSTLKELEPKVGKCIPLANKTKMWNEITNRFKEHGYIVSSKQLKNKYNGLERNYKKMIVRNKRTGNNNFTCPFQSELIEIQKNKPAIVPEYTLGTEASQSMESSSSTDENTAYMIDENTAYDIDEPFCGTPERKLRPESAKKLTSVAIELRKLREIDEITGFGTDEPLSGTPESKLRPERVRKRNSVAIELRKLRGIDESTAYRIDENTAFEIEEPLGTPESELRLEPVRKQNSVAVELQKLRELKSTQWKLLNKAKDHYYEQKLEILRRKEQRLERYLRRKEEHMAKKEKYWANCRR